MLGWLSAIWALHWGCLIGIAGLTGAVLLMGHQQRLHAKERQRDKRILDEFWAYAHFDARLDGDDVRSFAKRVCRLIAKNSAFQRVAMLAQDREGRMYVAGSAGMEEITVQALQAWADRVAEEDADEDARPERAGIPFGEKSFAVVLGRDSADLGCGRAIMVPLWTTEGQVKGALAVCADRLMSVRRQTVEETIPPLEALAAKLGRTMENTELSQRLLRAEKLAGSGLLASGVAHALTNPLTSVLGMAELIMKTTGEKRVRADAETIVHEARRMRKIVQELLNFGQSGTRHGEPVDTAGLVAELATECRSKLEDRRVRLSVMADDMVPAVWGNGEKLRLLMEHLLNNAAQAIASVGEDVEREREIRVSVSRDAASVQIIVSDTGPGFKEPEQVFDPFHPARQSGEATGVGLGICYGIVREHGGEISAFNLHPYGAAVVVELPLGETLAGSFSGDAQEVA